MSKLAIIFLACLVSSLVAWLCNKLIAKYWPKTGKWGINSENISCPECRKAVPKVRKPKNMKQMLSGGWTCNKCGTEMDKYGTKIN